ncbi:MULTISPECIES: protein translocase subunit SecF [unclassified Roseofilum]|uniref:protein translocase subunit SecF n=1 Tax=unclassified Roseofilum TaxID=2620099 RepID=UPI001B04D953|nr:MULTISPECIES: protein translocase subunit SecF [unclassified Roseofilum]MBP0009233.1 protein translocase subunit SecF [Roseofilum sp. Belize Diploria]MBP0014861.1 protein translocase subunit SecF [Roseofilum sp. SID3]MBP0024634.1 protein translocase subunit SecF [Roseofilum sp. SID2]MBP0036670.1 protein translocase subunit SecF [Roseofilum sp. SID1]MBP0043392.1 protein translocase subunit SecF [Roseofilum sp. SBFL]
MISIIKQRNLWWSISAGVILMGFLAMAISWGSPGIGAPLRPGLDFVGGTRLQLDLDCTEVGNCDQPIEIAKVREVTDRLGIANPNIQITGEDGTGVSIRTKDLDVEERTELQNSLAEAIGTFDVTQTQIDTVGPTLGKQLFTSGLLALLVAFAGITLYLNFRFQLDYAFFAFVALFHDVFVTMGVFSILGLIAGVEIDSLFIVSLLTIIGFSVNDTVVIYDRVRETLQFYPEKHINDVVDEAVNQTLMRSLNTSITTILPLVAIFFLGGETLKFFALALIIGFISGAYSSIFIASTLLAWWREKTGRAILATVTEGEGEILDSTPTTD